MKVVSREDFAASKWLRRPGHHFAAASPTAPVAAAEFAECVRAFPLGFMAQEGGTALVALFGLLPGQNLFVAPDGRWLGRYVPAVLRGYPFRLARTDAGTLALCIDEDSGLVRDLAVGEEGVPFFGDDGKPHPETQKMADFLTLTHRGIEHTGRAASLLAEMELLEPWPLKASDGEVEKTVTGVSRVDEKKLNALSGDDLARLRDGGALALAYGQLLSMGNLSTLSTLAQLRDHYAKAQASRMAIPEGSFLAEEDDSLKIDWNAFLKDD